MYSKKAKKCFPLDGSRVYDYFLVTAIIGGTIVVDDSI